MQNQTEDEDKDPTSGEDNSDEEETYTKLDIKRIVSECLSEEKGKRNKANSLKIHVDSKIACYVINYISKSKSNDTTPLWMRLSRKANIKSSGKWRQACADTGCTVPVIPEKIAKEEGLVIDRIDQDEPPPHCLWRQ